MIEKRSTKKLTKTVTALVEGFKECWPDFDITTNDLINPTLATAIKIYERFIHDFGISTETIMRVLFENSDEDNMYIYVLCFCANQIYHEIYLPTLPSIPLLTLSSFLSSAVDESFITRISLFANYLYYAKAVVQNIITPKRNQVMEKVDVLDAINEKISLLNEHLKTATHNDAKNEDNLKYLRNNTNNLKDNISELQEISEHLQKRGFQLLTELQLLGDETSGLTESVEKQVIKIKEFKSSIVEDHESMQSKYKKIESEIEEIRAQLSEHRTNLESKTKTESGFMKNCEAISALSQNSNLPKSTELFNSREKCKLEIDVIQKDYLALKNVESQEMALKNETKDEFPKVQTNYQNLNAESSSQLKFFDEDLAKSIALLEVIEKKYEEKNVQTAELRDRLKIFNKCFEEYTKSSAEQEAFYEMQYKHFSDAQSKHDRKGVEVLKEIHDAFTKKKHHK